MRSVHFLPHLRKIFSKSQQATVNVRDVISL